MEIKIIEGTFEKNDALALIERIIKTKIQFLEEKIQLADQAEDVKFKEKRIIALQDELSLVRSSLNDGLIALNASIAVNEKK